jgi:hypothetical protein
MGKLLCAVRVTSKEVDFKIPQPPFSKGGTEGTEPANFFIERMALHAITSFWEFIQFRMNFY